MTTKSLNRAVLLRLAQTGRLVLVSSYRGEHRTEKTLPVAMKPSNPTDYQEGICYLTETDFNTRAGRAWITDGVVTLYVHKHSSYDFRIKEATKEEASETRRKGRARYYVRRR